MTVAMPLAFDAAEDHDLMKTLTMLDAEFAPLSEEDLALIGHDLLAFGGSGSIGDSSPFSIEDFLVPASKPLASLPAALPPVVVPMVPLAELHSKQSSSPHSSDSWQPAGSDAASDSASDSALHSPASSKPPLGQRKDPRIGKRKPCPDLNSIEDVQERRKQRRLAKNRATAAVSRERKRVQMALLTARTQELEDAVRVRDAEISALRRQLAAAGVAI